MMGQDIKERTRFSECAPSVIWLLGLASEHSGKSFCRDSGLEE